MESMIRLLHGYVRISVKGVQCERFLNLCRARGIFLRNISRKEECELTCMLFASDFCSLKPIRSKTGVHIHIIKKYGWPFFFWKSRKRKAFFAGALAGILLLLLMSGKIWNIHVDGNLKNTTQEILLFLEEQGVVHGTAKSKINCSELAAAIRRRFPEITWVSARIQGTRLLLTIQEEELVDETPKELPVPCSLSADQEGTIVSMVTRAGVPQVAQGDICEKGDLLVSGRLEILNDSQEVVRYEYVHADADIYVEHEIPYYKEFSLNYEANVPEGSTETDYWIRIGNWILGSSLSSEKELMRESNERPLRITENYTLPVWFGKAYSEKTEKQQKKYTAEEAKALAVQELQYEEKNLMEKGVQISANNVKIEIDYDSCIARGTLTVIEKTGTEIPVEIPEQSEERTSENG